MVYLSRKIMLAFRECFEEKLKGFSVKTIDFNDNERIYILEDSLILLLSFEVDPMPVNASVNNELHKYKTHPYLEIPKSSETYYNFVIEELTPNTMGFKFNRVALVEEVESEFDVWDTNLHICYTKFKGYQRIYWCPEDETTAERMDRLLPELKLRERYEAWTGNLYNYIVYEVKDVNGNLFYAVSYTQGDVRSYINKMADEYIRTGTFSNGNTRREYSWDFDNTLRSWKELSRQKQLEEKLSFFVIREYQKEFDDVWKYADKLLEMSKKQQFEDIARMTYVKPTNKWCTEQVVYKLIKKIFKEYKVIYQHRPFFLKSSIGGQMSYDVYISGLNIAVEYQGKQHFEPVEYFGGVEGYKENQRRDKEKKELSEQNGIKLVYINYWEDVNEMLIREKINKALMEQ